MTRKQQAILRALAAAEGRGETLSIDDLIEALGEGASKQAMQSTLRFLEGKRLLARGYGLRDSRVKLLLELTPDGLFLGRSLLS